MFEKELPSISSAPSIAIDVGGTNTRIALFEQPATTHYQLLARFPTYQLYEQEQAAILAALTHAGLSSLSGIGISLGGRIAPDGRSVLVAPNLPGYIGKPLVADLEHSYSCPVRLAHDTVCGLLGELRFGVLQQADRAAYLTLSTGTGAAVYLRKGAHAMALSIEIGHQILDGNQLICLCGQTGCLETYTGGRQLELRLGKPLSSSTSSTIWEILCKKLALGLVNLAQLTRVELVAVSGAIALHNPTLLVQMQQEINTLLRGATLELRVASLEEHAPLVGAAQLLSVTEDSILH